MAPRPGSLRARERRQPAEFRSRRRGDGARARPPGQGRVAAVGDARRLRRRTPRCSPRPSCSRRAPTDVLEANARDVAAAQDAGIAPGLVDRLRLDASRIAAMAGGLRQVASLAGSRRRGARRLGPPERAAHLAGAGPPRRGRDHLREPAERHLRRRGAVPQVGQRGVPARLVDGGALQHRDRRRCCARRSARSGCPRTRSCSSRTPSRAAAVEFMQQRGLVDCLIPRGGTSLIASILEHATVPFVIDGDGNCHVYVDASADLDMAESILVNAKTQRPSVCNAAESLVLHSAIAERVPRPGRHGAGGRRAGRRRSVPVAPGADRAGHRRGLRDRVPGPEAVGGRGRLARRRDRPRQRPLLGALRGHRHRGPAHAPSGSWPRSTPLRCW